MQPSIEHAASSEAWLRHTLEEILSQVRVLLDIDGCAFQTVDHEHQHIRPAASWFEHAELRSVMQPILDRPYDPERGGVTEAAVERGESILISDMGGWRGAGALRARLALQLDEAQANAAWDWYRTSSFISCPVRTTGGRTLGVLALSSSPPRPPLDEEHLRVTEVFAGLAALALERSELLEREARRSRTEQLLHGAAQKMTASLDLDVVYGLIVEQAALVAGAPTALLLRLDDVTQTLRAVAQVGASARMSRHHYALGEGMLGAVAESGEGYASRDEDRRRFLPWITDEGVGSFVHVPIDLGPRRFGVLTVSHPERDALGQPALELLQSLTRPAAAAIANALEFQHERRIATALTRGFIPDAPPELDDFELGLVYEPVGHEVSGGDIFGVWRLPGGALAVLVGDVCGKGLEVAAVSAMVRFFVEARTRLRSERPDGAASRALFAEYLADVRGRLGEDFVPTERVFGSDEAFAAVGAAWLVVYEDGRPVACGGLRTLAPGVGEIKRIFVTATARGRGHARRLLGALERRAGEHGHRSVRLLTTDVLHEAIALYEAAGYRVVGRVEHPRAPVEVWLEKPLTYS